jgi:membrane-bound serine protease (ClpP class)
MKVVNKKLLILCLAAFTLFSASALFAESRYGVVRLNGSVNPIVAEYIAESIELAAEEGNSFVVLQMDTPGGLMDSMREIIKSILTSKIPVVVYTYPKGAQAASAGGFIMLSAHIAAMSPGTEIGAMHPVSPMLDFMKKDKQGGPEGVMEKKVLNDTIAYARSLAQKRGRNVNWTVDAVSRAISSSYLEAHKLGVIDIIAEDMNDLLTQMHNRKIDLNGNPFTFKTDGAVAVKYEMTWKQSMVNKFADPQVILFLFLVAIAGIGMEFKNPGMIFPGAIGSAALILFLLGIRIIPINGLGLLLIVLAFILFVLELQFVSYGLLTIGGIVSFIFGAKILFDSPLPGGGLPWSTIIVLVLVVMAFVFIVLRAILEVHKTKVTTGWDGMIDSQGVALDDFNDRNEGKIRVHGEIWSAVSDEKILKGEKVTVVEITTGMVLRVKSIT